MRKFFQKHANLPWTFAAVVLSVVFAAIGFFEPVLVWKETEEDREKQSMIQLMWVDLARQSEEEYFRGATTLVRAEIVSYDGRFCYDAPTAEDMWFSRSVFTFRVKEVLYDNAPVRPVKAGKTYRMYNDLYMGNYNQYHGFIGEEVLILLDGDPIISTQSGGVIYNAKAYQQDYTNRMGYRIANSKWGVIPIARSEQIVYTHLPNCLRREELWTGDELAQYMTEQLEKYTS